MYFHKRTLAKRKKNRIDGLIINDKWCYDGDRLKKHVVDFFKDLYLTSYAVAGVLPCHGAFPEIDSIEKESLINFASNEKINRAIFSMSPLKAPRLDRFLAKFFQTNWEVVSQSIRL